MQVSAEHCYPAGGVHRAWCCGASRWLMIPNMWWCMQIKDLGVKAGVVLNPVTSLSMIEHVIPHVDLILLMSGTSQQWCMPS